MRVGFGLPCLVVLLFVIVDPGMAQQKSTPSQQKSAPAQQNAPVQQPSAPAQQPSPQDNLWAQIEMEARSKPRRYRGDRNDRRPKGYGFSKLCWYTTVPR